MSNAINPKLRRSRGRPRKTVIGGFSNAHSLPTTFKQAPNYVPPKRKQVLESLSDEIQIIDLNGFENIQSKKLKLADPLDDPNIQKRSLPHRAARFTESYGGTSPDVVVISDEEGQDEAESESDSDSDCGPIPSPVIVVKSKEELEQYEENIRNLKQLLSDEEMKLVLLKKLQDSQKTKDTKPDSTHSPIPTNTGQTTQKTSSAPLKSGVQIQPLPSKQLIFNSKVSAKKEMKLESTSQFNKITPKAHSTNSISMKHAVKAESNNSATTPAVSSSSAEKINSSHLQQYPLLKNLSAQITITAVPPIGPPSTSNHSQPATLTVTNKQSHSNAPVLQEDKVESLSQRQAAAKLALRKQLEKTLLQIPLPKPPPLKINFFPNANSIEFLCLLGLDFVVDFLTKTKKSSQSNPLCCAQCSTDFTCAWKWKEVEKDGVKSYDAFCEACITSNIRKSLKAQHTNSLKAAFLKALHQEKEIDKLTSSQVPSSKSQTLAPRPAQSQRPLPSPAHQNTAASVLPLPKHSNVMPYIPKMTPNLNHAAALAQMSKLSPQYQSLLQFQAQHLLAAGMPLHPSMLTSFMAPNHSRGKQSLVQNDLRRQYRSDRVQSPSIPHSSSSWKA